MKTTRLIVTCDVECSIGNSGSFDHPIFRPWPIDTWIWGRIGGSERQWGIGLLMDQLEARQMRGTFYVSALERRFHGDPPVAEVAKAIESRGHEAGVHVHCAWAGFDQQRRYDLDRGFHLLDSIGDHDEETQRELLTEAVESLRQWTGRPPRSFRAGNFGADLRTLKILGELGLTSDSSRNAAVATLPQATATNAAVELEGLLEIPATTFEALRSPRRLLRFVDPSNMTLAEAKSVFDQIPRLGIGTLVLVTHSFQYISPGHVAGERVESHPKIVDRVSRILDLLAEDPRYSSCTMREAAELPRDQLVRADGLPSNPAWMTPIRFAQSRADALPFR